MTHSLSAGRADPLGATWDGEGVNFAVFSSEATAVELCLFEGEAEVARIALHERDGDVWHVRVAGLGPGTCYGWRVHGPYRPAEGLRFNPHKLLIDPYAQRLTGGFRAVDALHGYPVGGPEADLGFDTVDSAFAVPKCVVVDPAHDWGGDAPLRRPAGETILYEAHVKGLTATHPAIDAGLRGRFGALAHPAMLDHLTKLGVTAVQLLPVQTTMADATLISRGLTNYWGYQTLGFFAPDLRFAGDDAIAEFRRMVAGLHSAGIEVILDVVYNHTAEGNERGTTVAFRGLDNRAYYRLADDPRYYADDTGCGNTLNLTHPMVLRMVMDSLRHWVSAMHVDGFRFDLATTLARGPQGFDVAGGFLQAIRQDPVLRGVRLIAEPWDCGPGGYQLGNFPHPFLELNDRYRDDVRRFWRGDGGMLPDLARRLTGSAELFDRAGRAAISSVNKLASHDGLTLEDVVSYAAKRNHANGEDNRDGHDPNYSEAIGGEGPTGDEGVRAARDLRKRNLLATLFLSQGTPMLLAGDELGNTQGGNNNAYCQDNDVSWIDWASADMDLAAFVARLTALRRDHPVLRQARFLHARPRLRDGYSDIFWRRPDGTDATRDDWHDPAWTALCVEIRSAAGTQPYAKTDEVIFAVLNAGEACDVALPGERHGRPWICVLRTDAPEQGETALRAAQDRVGARSVTIYSA